MDLIYRPLKTELLRRAKRRGIETISGVDMFLAQGIAQWELWMGNPRLKSVMRQVVVRRVAEGRASPPADDRARFSDVFAAWPAKAISFRSTKPLRPIC